ncbi:MAG: hypothetical protein JSV77_04975 [Dehalococcoidales bacterium]|nr:MAG: hypothetical protein JSV77_04975 [Dehalococcoidales bacterium]
MIERTPASKDKNLSGISSEEWRSPEQAGNYLAELLSQAENAYTMYRQAQKEVANGYKTQEQQLEKDYREAEKRASEALDRALDRARRNREQAEQKAAEDFRTAMDESAEDFKKWAVEAIKTRNEEVEQAWKIYNEIHGKMWSIIESNQEIETIYWDWDKSLLTRLSWRIGKKFGERAVEAFRTTKVYW